MLSSSWVSIVLSRKLANSSSFVIDIIRHFAYVFFLEESRNASYVPPAFFKSQTLAVIVLPLPVGSTKSVLKEDCTFITLF